MTRQDIEAITAARHRRLACRAAAERLTQIESFLSGVTYAGRPRDAWGWLEMTDDELLAAVNTTVVSHDVWHYCLELLTARTQAAATRTICRVYGETHSSCRR
jgi:hypothetical protein